MRRRRRLGTFLTGAGEMLGRALPGASALVRPVVVEIGASIFVGVGLEPARHSRHDVPSPVVPRVNPVMLSNVTLGFLVLPSGIA